MGGFGLAWGVQVPVNLSIAKTQILVWMRVANDSVHHQEHILLLFMCFGGTVFTWELNLCPVLGG